MNRLTLELAVIGLFAVVVNALAAMASGPIGLVLLLLGNVAVLWLVVNAVFVALDGFLDLKLRGLE